jgi:YHS domain-containing protein
MRFSSGILTLSIALGTLVVTLPSPADAKNPMGDTVKQVNPKFVCSVDKNHSNEKPVSEVCPAKLTEDPKSGSEIDPVSGKEVEKATATVGVDRAGNVYFFENAKNLKQFRVPVEATESEPALTWRPAHPRR